MSKGPLRIGLSACMFHPDPERNIFKGKRLLYVEESMAHWLMSQGALPVLLPTTPPAGVSLHDLIAEVDGLVMTGGVDVAPQSYGETPLKPEWAGDPHRDAYEIALIEAALTLDRPVLGVCRGLQVMNVARGGTLFQDIKTQNPDALMHRDAEIYDANRHQVRLERSSPLGKVYGDVGLATINSVHHQAVKDLGRDMMVEARSAEDDIVEAIRLKDDPRTGAYYAGVQWHPEFQDPEDRTLLSPTPILTDFLQAVRRRRR